MAKVVEANIRQTRALENILEPLVGGVGRGGLLRGTAAREKKAACERGEITLEEFQEWLRKE